MKRNIAAVVLAAGASSRMGTAKQLLRLGSRTLLRRSVEEALASAARETVVVVGAEAERMRHELRDLPVVTVENTRWAEGIGSSVSAAADFIRRQQPEFDALVLMTCDQPHVSAATIDRLIAEHDVSAKSIAASGYAGTIGVPALFSRACFDALSQLPADRGAKDILLRHRTDVAEVEFEPGATDLDTPADYERFTGSRATS